MARLLLRLRREEQSLTLDQVDLIYGSCIQDVCTLVIAKSITNVFTGRRCWKAHGTNKGSPGFFRQ